MRHREPKPTPLNLDLPETDLHCPAPGEPDHQAHAAKSHPKSSVSFSGGVDLGLIEAGKSGQGGRTDDPF